MSQKSNMVTEGSNKRKATVLAEGNNTEVDLTALLMDFIKRSDERAEKIEERLERMEERLETTEEQDSLEQSLEEIVKASSEEDLSDDEESIDDESDPWSIMFQALREYKMMNDHCRVPQTFKENPKLGRWVKKQRFLYNNVQTGKGTKINPEKIARLESIGFDWGKKYPPPQSWDDMFERLEGFYRKMGHCRIPFQPANPSALAKWTACQRAEYKRFRKNRDSLLTKDRMDRLREIGFDWKGPKL